MPIYDFQCPACGIVQEVLQKNFKSEIQLCECGAEMEKITGRTSLLLKFKGKGFYVNDYKRK